MTFSDFIKKAIGIPFKDKGRDFAGWDCYGMVVKCYGECFNIDLPDMEGCRSMKYEQSIAIFDSMAISYSEVTHGRERAGDVIMLRGSPCHVGIVVRPGYMLHVEEKCATCIESYYHGLYKTRIIGIYRHGKLSS